MTEGSTVPVTVSLKLDPRNSMARVIDEDQRRGKRQGRENADRMRFSRYRSFEYSAIARGTIVRKRRKKEGKNPGAVSLVASSASRGSGTFVPGKKKNAQVAVDQGSAGFMIAHRKWSFAFICQT